MPWGPHWHHQLTDSSGKTIEISCSSDNMYLHIVHVSYVRQIMTCCMYMYMYLFIVVWILTEVFMELLREWWILRGQDAGACQYVLQTNAGKTFGKNYWISNFTDRRIYYMIEMALGPLLLFNMHNISEKEIRGCVCFRTLCISAPVAWRMRNCTDIMPWTSLCTPTSPAPSGDTLMSWYTEHYQLS